MNAPNVILKIKDTLTNFVANMNTSTDKRRASTFKKRGILDQEQLGALYREDWIAGKIVDIIPDEMTRAWRSFNDSELTPEQIEELEKAEKKLKVAYKFNEAKKWARLYGGSIIVMNIEGTGEPHEPLDIGRIKEGSLKSLLVYDSINAHYQTINQTDPFADNFLMPELYTLSHSSVRIHHTRILRFDGQLIPMNELRVNRYWHDSTLNRVYEALINSNIANDSTAGLLFESNVDVIKVKGLMNMLATKDGEKTLVERFQLAKYLKSNNNMTLLDSEEEYEKHSNTFSGIPDVLDRFMQIISAASDIPATRLFSKAPVGMNATGESDLRNFYDHIREKQEFEFTPLLEKFDQVLAKHLGLDPENMQYKFNSLWQLSDKESSEIKLNNAQADQIYNDMGVVPESVIAKELQQNDTYSNLDSDHIEMLEEFEKEQPEENEEGEEENEIPNEEGTEETGGEDETEEQALEKEEKEGDE